MTKGLKRDVWQRKRHDNWDDAEIEVVSGDQGVTVSVSEEQAMDSYNRTFTCQYVLTQDEAFALWVWLGGVLADNPAGGAT